MEWLVIEDFMGLIPFTLIIAGIFGVVALATVAYGFFFGPGKQDGGEHRVS